MADYGYPNARIRAMKSLLFDPSFYKTLLEMDTVHSIITALEETPYRKDIEDGTLRYPGIAGVEEGLRKNIIHTFQKILEIAEMGGKEVKELVRLLLSRWDVYNIKTVIRGKHIGASREEILDSLIPAGELHEVLLKELAEAKDIKECLDLLALWEVPYGRPLTAAFPQYVKSQKLVDLELPLDKFAYEHVLKKTKGVSLNCRLVREIFRREIDFVNIMTLLRLTREKVKPEEAVKLFIEGGKEISLDDFKELVQIKKPEEVIDRLKKTSYWEPLNVALKHYMEAGAISPLERSMEDLIIKKNISLFRADPLTIGLIIAYIWAKYNEVVNLRILVRGKAMGIPKETIWRYLVFV